VFLNRVMELNLAADDIAALESRTEGWIAGLQLAALAMQDRADATSFVATFAGSHHYIVDYLMEEVLGRQTREVQTFLLHTSILERLNGPLCNAVTGSTDGQAMLEKLEKENLFLVRLDDERHWYRYHYLLAYSLQGRLQQAEPDIVTHLHRRAAGWFEHTGLIEEALNHWTQAQDFEQAAQVVEQKGIEMLALGEMTALRRWMDTLPVELVHQRPWLCVLSAWTLLLGWDMEGIKTRIQHAQCCLSSQVPSTQDNEIAGHIAAIQAYIAGMERDDQQAYDLCRQALALLPERSTFLRGLIAYLFGTLNLRSGDLDGARVALEEASQMSQASGVLHVAIPALTALGIVQSIQGKLYLAYENYQKALQLSARGRRHPLPVAATANNSIGELLYEWNDLDDAEQHLARGLDQSKQWGSAEDLVNNATTRARLCQARGHWQDAWNEIEQVKHAIPTPQLRIGQIITTRIRFCLDRGDLDTAERLVQTGKIRAKDDLNLNNLEELIVLARLRQAQGRFAEALRLLNHLQTFSQATRLTGPLIEILRLQALTLKAQGQTEQALALLKDALSLAEPGGYTRSFVDEGQEMAELLEQLGDSLRRERLTSKAPEVDRLIRYTHKLLDAFGRDTSQTVDDIPATKSRHPSKETLIEPLSERELEVLRLLVAGKSNRDIADELVIAVGTVKKHLSNIFGKLGAQNRTECAARARELNLV
jgi:LuxR family maltose regulon positive regulatory protein